MEKKKYVKPAVMFESFSLSSHVAAGCAKKPNSAEFACPVEVPEWGITVFGDLNCDYSTPDGNDMVCYHVPTADNNVFSS